MHQSKVVVCSLRELVGAAALLLAAGCSAGAEGPEELGSELFEGTELDTSSGALTYCQGASCDGLNPQQTACVFDMQDTGVGAGIFDTAGRQIGGIGLFRSASCNTVWAATAFYTAQGPRNFRVCSVRRRALDNDSSCFDYNGSFGNVGPMKYVPSGKVAFGRTFLLNNPAIKGVTPDYTAP